ncbi:MAG: ABC transporter substrate-binding protein [Synergistaceae bacterium]|nr:ABC transporter substrate-binding protein [Synergistaceae bacterium]
MKKIAVFTFVMILLASVQACAGNSAVKIGMYTPLTGNSAAAGETVRRAAEIAVDEINASGGINGAKIELIIYDDAGTTEGAVKAATRLIDLDEVSVIIGDYLSANMLATYPVTEDAKILQIGLGTASSWTNIGCKYLFRATAVASLPIKSFIQLMKQIGDKHIALITAESEYGQTGRRAMLEELKAQGIGVAADVTYQPSDTDFTGLIAKVMQEKPDGIVIYGVSTELPQLMKQIRQQGYTDTVYTGECGSNSDFLAVTGEAANGLVFASAYFMPETPEGGTSEIQRRFLRAFYEKYHEMPYAESAFRAYDAVYLAAEALKNAEDITDGESIRNAFAAIDGCEGIGGVFNYTDESGDGLSTCNAYMILDGRVRRFDIEALRRFEK